ncbi:MAG: glycosyl hydrolase family 1 [Desulfobulbus propionicus]|nr:MAG: glycosyl hydrolase family 1 [Desulfobulbus propionicus]
MKVAIIHNQFNKSGGMESYLLTLVEGFRAVGDEVHIHAYKADLDLARQHGCIVHRTPVFFLPRRLKKYFFLFRYNNGFDKRKYDLTVSLTRTSCQDIAIVGGVHPQSVLARKTCNLYRSMHDMVENRFEHRMMSSTPAIVAHSASIQEEILRHYDISDRKVHVLYPPINEKRFARSLLMDKQQARERYAVDGGKLTLLFPSLSHKRKGLASLLTAWAKLDTDRFELIIVGDAVRRSRTLASHVRCIGYVDDMATLYRAVDYVILPSHYEPFGLVIAESLACGTPVITTAQVGAAELLTDEDGIILQDNEPATILQALMTLKRKTVPPGFAARYGLEIGQHIERLKELAFKVRNHAHGA